MTAFLDTNVILRFLLRDDEEKFQRCYALLKRVELGEERLVASDPVITEAVWIMETKPYSLGRGRIRDLLVPIIQLRGLTLPGRELLQRALELYARTRIDFVDAYNAAIMQRRGLDRIYSYDTDFDRVPGLTRVEP